MKKDLSGVVKFFVWPHCLLGMTSPVWTFNDQDLLKTQVDVIVGSYTACVLLTLLLFLSDPAHPPGSWVVCSLSRKP